MVKFSVGNRRYIYVHDRERPVEAIDIHHVISENSRSSVFLLSLLFILVLANAVYLFFDKDSSIAVVLWSIFLSGFISISVTRKTVKKETVIIMPAFGVQFETHYSSGRMDSRFIPIDKILKPILSECVTPLTCYWSLSLLLLGEEELLPVFKELSPPVKILVPIWKALCAAVDPKQSESVVEEE